MDSTLELESKLTELLLDLKVVASANNESNLLAYLGKHLGRRERSTGCVAHQLKGSEKQAQQEDPFKKLLECQVKRGNL